MRSVSLLDLLRTPDVSPGARWLLGSAILLHALGTWLIVFGARQTHFGNYLLMVLEYSQDRTRRVEHFDAHLRRAQEAAAVGASGGP